MAVIEGGTYITGGAIPGSKTRRYVGSGAPVAGTTLAGVIAVGELYEDVDTGFVYEYTEPAAVATFTRIDTA